jgi:ABC-type transport system involved in cytochrome bd biosynthesis fused ATPase/permease subunit
MEFVYPSKATNNSYSHLLLDVSWIHEAHLLTHAILHTHKEALSQTRMTTNFVHTIGVVFQLTDNWETYACDYIVSAMQLTYNYSNSDVIQKINFEVTTI